jgi:hypothetical protein
MPEKKDVYIQIKMTTKEKQSVKAVAKRKGLSLSGVMRLAFSEYADRQSTQLPKDSFDKQ